MNATDGALLWNTTIGSISRSSPCIAGGVVFVGSDGVASSKEGTSPNNIYALNATTGTTIWTCTTGGAVYSSPAVGYGVVYVGSNDGKVYAIGTNQSPPSSEPTATPSPTQTCSTPMPTPTESTTANPTPSPSIPEFSFCTVVVVIVLVMFTAIIFKRSKEHRKSKNDRYLRTLS